MIFSIRDANYIPNPKTTVPQPLKRNYDYGEIPNWIDRVKWHQKKMKKRKSALDAIVKASSNIKFWISPKGEFHSWPVASYESAPHHNRMIREIAPGYFSGDLNRHEQELAAAEWDGWVDGGNIDGKFYIRTYPDRAIDKLQHVPEQYRKADSIHFENSDETIETFGQDVLNATEKYVKGFDKVTAALRISSRDAVEDTIRYWDLAKNKDFSKYWRLLRKIKRKR